MHLDRVDIHNHTYYSNIRLLDAIDSVEGLIDRAIEIGLKGIAITDHETLSSHVKAIKYRDKIKEKNPDFKVILGNEIYLVDERPADNHYHFILLAKNEVGHKQIRRLSSQAWMNSYFHKGKLERVDTLKSDLESIVRENKGNLIASSACIGGELGQSILKLTEAEKAKNKDEAMKWHQHIVDFLLWCKDLFGDDFYLEVQPGINKEQIIVNRRMLSIAAAFNIKMILTSDSHYLKKEDRYVHKAYLNSKDGEREVDSFYQDAYLHEEEEIFEKLKLSDYNIEFIKQMFNNSMEIYDKIEEFTLFHKQRIPKVEVKEYPKVEKDLTKESEKYPTLCALAKSDDNVHRYWINECVNKLKEIGKYNEQYLLRLEEEASSKKIVGDKLETNMFSYPVTLQHYIDMIWDCGSIVGAGRGSSCSGLNHYLLGVTQIDPIEWNFPFWRYCNPERIELGDIDLDLCPSKRPLVINKIKEERGRNFKENIDALSKQNLGCSLVATFGTETTKSAILTACRGYRSEEYPDGIDVDTAQYLSTLAPSERGFLWPLKDIVNGNPDKDRKPITSFIKEVNKYPGLLDIMTNIEGVINKRSSHASGIVFADDDPYEFLCYMRTPKGEIITQYDLHDSEFCGAVKYDFLLTEVSDKIVECIKLLQNDGKIEKDKSLREIYNKYLHPSVLPINDEQVWKAIQNNEVLNIFQFDSDVGSQAIKKIKPKSMYELTDSNGLMRLMTAEKGGESPLDKYARYKNNISLWYKEMDTCGLSKEEQKTIEPYFKSSYGVPPSQEQLMQMVMDKDICNFSLAEANDARKIVGKKIMSKIPELRDKILTKAKSKALGEYIWKYGVGPQVG